MGIVADAFAMLEVERAQPQYELVRYGVTWSPKRARVRKLIQHVGLSGPHLMVEGELYRFAFVFGKGVRHRLVTKVPGGIRGALSGFECDDPLSNVSFGYYLRKKKGER